MLTSVRVWLVHAAGWALAGPALGYLTGWPTLAVVLVVALGCAAHTTTEGT